MVGDAFHLDVSTWVNSDPVDIASLRGQVVMVEAFQMLCPGCVLHGIPQAQRVHRTFDRSDVVVLGLHTVFEHHDVTGPDALRAFLSEFKVRFPVAVDRPVEGRSIPATMAHYQLQGTPSTLLVDRRGQLRHVFLGAIEDLALGQILGRLIAEPAPDQDPPDAPIADGGSAGPEVCSIEDGCALD